MYTVYRYLSVIEESSSYHNGYNIMIVDTIYIRKKHFINSLFAKVKN